MKEVLREIMQAVGEEFHKNALAFHDRVVETAAPPGKEMTGPGRAAREENFKNAIELYKSSLWMFQETESEIDIGHVYQNMGELYSARKNHGEAVKHLEKALAIARKLHDERTKKSVLSLLVQEYEGSGGYLTQVGRYDEALECYEKQRSAYEEMEDRTGVGRAFSLIGDCHRITGFHGKAAAAYRQCVNIGNETKSARLRASGLTLLGKLYHERGDFDAAAKYYHESLTISRSAEDEAMQSWSLPPLAQLYVDQGQYDLAIHWFVKAATLARKTERLTDETNAYTGSGRAYALRGQYGRATEMFRKALIVSRKAGEPTDSIKYHIADLYLEMGKADRAAPLIKEAGTWASRGRLDLMRADYSEAGKWYEQVLKAAEKSGQVQTLFLALTGLGHASEGLGEYERAVEYFRKAADLTEQLRRSLKKSERQKFFDVRVEGFYRTAPYEGLARVLMKMDKPAEALKASEYTKARVFAESMSQMREGANLDVPADIMAKHDALTSRIAALRTNKRQAFEKGNQDLTRSLDTEIKDVESKLGELISMLREKYPKFAATRYPEPMDLAQTMLRDNEWVLAYDVTDTGLLICLIKGRQVVKGLFKPVIRRVFDGLVRKFREPMEIQAGESVSKELWKFDLATGKELSDLLLQEILPYLPKGAPVMIVPDDSLGVLPFEILVLNDRGKVELRDGMPVVSGAEFFGDRNPISYYQSITALTLARTFGIAKKAAAKKMVMADPVFDAKDDRLVKVNQQRRIVLMKSMPDKLMSIKNELNLTFPRLPLTGELAQNLKGLEPGKTDLYVGMNACKPVLFKKPLNGYGSMVFATHGYFGKDLPGIQEPVLILTLPGQPEGQDGFLRMSEVMGLKLNADVVALTACQTGLGRRLTGEGTMGMGRAFQYSGAKAVLMSLWSVSEKSSVMLVESFFKRLKEGKSKLDALKLAREEIRGAGYDHPFFWAGFILAGEVD